MCIYMSTLHTMPMATNSLDIRSMPLNGLTTTILPELTAFVFHRAQESLGSSRVNMSYEYLIR